MTTAPQIAREARRNLGLSQRDVAKQMGVSHVFIGNFERGATRLSPKRLKQLSAILKVTLEQPEKGKLTPTEAQWVAQALYMHANYIETGNVSFSAVDIDRMGVEMAKRMGAVLRPLSDDQRQRAARLHQLAVNVNMTLQLP